MSQEQSLSSLFHTLPYEILSQIVREACTPVISDDATDQNSALHGMPDLTFITDDPRVAQIQYEKVVPDALLFVVRQHTCDACDADIHAIGSYSFLFTEVQRPPFHSFINRSSTVNITIGCGPSCGTYTRDDHAIAFYSRQSSLNLLVLSRIAMLNRRHSKVIDIRCTPRSHQGALTIVEFLRHFSDMTYSLINGTVAFTTNEYSAIPFMEVLDLSSKLGRRLRFWSEGTSSQQIFLREAQRLLDDRIIPIHKLTAAALAGFKAFGWLHPALRPNFPGFFWPADIPEFTRSHVLRVAFAFITAQGLARRLLQQNAENELQNCAMFLKYGELSSVRRPLALLVETTRSFHVITEMQPPMAHAARPWRVQDLPYLKFMGTIYQTLIMLRIALLRASRNGQTLVSAVRLVFSARNQEYIIQFERGWKLISTLNMQIDALVDIDNHITRLTQAANIVIAVDGNSSLGPKLLQEPHWDHTDIATFAVKARELTRELNVHEIGYFDEDGEMVDTNILFDPIQLGPEIPRIPMISDWTNMERTLDSLNSYGVLRNL